MKRFLLLTLLSLTIAAMLLTVGCSDDESTTGSSDTSEIELFTDLFDNVDDAMAELIEAPFIFFDTIAAQGQVPSKPNWSSKVNSETITLTWLASTSYWYCTASYIDFGTTIIVTDSIQFRHGSVPVQYPIDDLLTQITSYATLYATGEGIDSASVWQNVIITHDLLTGGLSISGNGGTNASLSEEGCTIAWDYAQTFSNLSWYDDFFFDDYNDDIYCPYQGSIVHTGSISGQCDDSDESVSGSWSVTSNFNNGIATYEVLNDGTSWTLIDSCETGYSGGLSSADSLFVEGMFGDGSMEEFLNGLDMGFALMIEQGLMEPMNSPAKGHFGTTALQDTVIVSRISSYEYTNDGWHVFTFSANVVSDMDTLIFSGIDSLKAVVDGSPVDTIVELFGIDSIAHHAHVDLNSSNQLLAGNIHQQMGALINTGADTVVTFNGNVYDTLYLLVGYCEIIQTLEQTVSHLAINPEDDGVCPLFGQVTSHFGLDIGCLGDLGDINSLMVNGDWTVTAVANGNNTVTVTYENDAGFVSWSKTDNCVDLSQSLVSINHQIN